MGSGSDFQSTNLANHNLSRCPCHTFCGSRVDYVPRCTSALRVILIDRCKVRDNLRFVQIFLVKNSL